MQQAKAKDSSEIFADFTISRIDKDVRSSLTVEQLNAIRRALVANDTFSQHSVDWRGSISLFFARYYFVFLAGRDRRRNTRLQELRRAHKGNIPIGILLSFLFFSFLAALLWISVILVLYWLKREMGIDLFPGLHLADFFKSANG